ncbi:MAG: hypothetical protein EBX41_03090 [Chitinophagia bacterium]|nr:hypothetical protein [Chitinophagia bacterium]
MELKHFVIALFCIISLNACNIADQHEAQLFYKSTSAITDSLHIVTLNWHNKLRQAIQTNNYSDLNAERVKMGKYIAASRNTVANIKLNKDNEKITTTLAALLNKQSQKVSEVYPLFELMGSYTPQPVLDKAIATLSTDLYDETQAHKALRKSLDAYKKKYGIK